MSDTTASERPARTFVVISLDAQRRGWDFISDHHTRRGAVLALLDEWARPRMARIIRRPKHWGAR